MPKLQTFPNVSEGLEGKAENSSTKTLAPIYFFLFVGSGACSLVYQVVWLRQAFAAFGVITPVLSVVVSVFMSGIFAGSWIAGNFAQRWVEKTGRSALFWYGATELGIGIWSLFVPSLFSWGEKILLQTGQTNSFGYLALSGIFLATALFPACFLMGTTYPWVMAHLGGTKNGAEKSFSFLYLGNVIGAVLGSTLSSLVGIEVFGIRGTGLLCAGLNGVLGLVSLWLGRPSATLSPVRRLTLVPTSRAAPMDHSTLILLFTTGFASMAFEVAWTRAFTPVLKTQVYSFAVLLTTYLVATTLGSLYYRRKGAVSAVPAAAVVGGILAFTALLPVWMNEPRLLNGLPLRVVVVLFSIVPFSAYLGYLTPCLVDRYSQGDARAAGRAYAVNVLGCIFGPLLAGYLLLPWLGVRYCLILLSLPFVVYFVVRLRDLSLRRRILGTVGVAGSLIVGLFFSSSYEEAYYGYGDKVEIRRDTTATVMSVAKGKDKMLSVNGFSMTSKTQATKMMAHLPLALLGHPPEAALTICFGMGTTFRSLLSWGIDTTAVELVPSVAEAFPFYFDDATRLMNHPKGHILVDDGRRFLARSRLSFDLITIDPPPPVEAASSSLLYTTEFYALAKQRMKPGAILQQWFPGGEKAILKAVAASLAASFKYVTAFVGLEGWGIHFVASDEPLNVLSPSQALAKMPPAAVADMVEWAEGATAEQQLQVSFNTTVPMAELVQGAEPITDDRPFNEYFLIRRLSSASSANESLAQRLFPQSWTSYR